MPKVKIEGLDGSGPLVVDGVDFSSAPVSFHEKIINEHVPPNYNPVGGWLVVGRGSAPWTFRVRHDALGTIEVIDCQSMYSAANFGHGNRKILDPFTRFMREDYLAIARSLNHNKHAPAVFAINQLLGGGGWDILNDPHILEHESWRTFFKNSGGEATDIAIKVARKNWWLKNGKPETCPGREYPYIIVASNCFHGRPLGATTLLEGKSREGFDPLRGSLHVPFNNLIALRSILERERGKVAAVFLEPIQGEGGVIIPSDDYLPGVEKLCREFGVLFMLDEVQTGFGRTGDNFVFQRYDLKPDVITLGKSLGAGVEPVSAAVGRAHLNHDPLYCLGPGTEGSTMSANPKACFAVLLAIKELGDGDYARVARENGEAFMAELREVARKYPQVVKEVRGRGLMIAIETHTPAREISENLLPNGVWAFPSREKVIRVLPPLCTPSSVLKEVAKALDKTLAQMVGN